MTKASTESSTTCRSAREELLVLAPNWLGDAVMATPFCAALRGRFADSRITVFCRSYVADIFRGNRSIDRIVEYGGAHARSRSGAVASRRPRGGYDACFVLPPSFAAALLSLVSRARRRIGYAGELRSVFLTDAIPATGYRTGHISRAYIRLLERFTEIAENDVALPLVVPPESWRETVRKIAGGREYFVLASGATYGSSKVWPHERYAGLARLIAARKGWLPLVAGRAEERDGAAALLKAAETAGINCAGALSLAELTAVLRGARVVIGNDSGPVHISAALGVPTVAIFGPTSVAWTAPRGAAVRIVRGEAQCAPCYKRECPLGSSACMVRVGIEDVFQSAVSLSEEGSQ